MDIDVVVKIVGAAIALIGLPKLYWDLHLSRRTTLQTDYQFAKAFLNEVEEAKLNNKPLHPFVLERGYKALVGNQWITANEVKYLLQFDDAYHVLHDYTRVQRVFKRFDDKAKVKIRFKAHYRYLPVRYLVIALYLILYLIAGIAAMSPLFKPTLPLNDELLFSSLIYSIPICGPFAAYFLMNGLRLAIANRLYKKQLQHIQHCYLQGTFL
ncbi:TPA: hypothetical protein ACX6Q7_002033 [Photobacterium damselae]